MEQILQMLIEDDLKINHLIHVLSKLQIDATCYLTHNSTVIFRITGISSTGTEDHLFDDYFKLIEKNATLELDQEQLRAKAREIAQIVLSWQSDLSAREAC